MISTQICEKTVDENYLESLYLELFPPVASYIAKKGGTLEDAKDVFQESLILFYEKIVDGTDIRDEKAYLLGIVRIRWINFINQRKHESPLKAPDQNLNISESEENVSFNKVVLFLETAGQKCLKLLTSFYFEKLTMDQLAVKFGFSGTRSATVQKYKCLEKVKKVVKQNNISYADFLE